MPEDYILDALETVSTWDLPEKDLADAVNAQAKLSNGGIYKAPTGDRFFHVVCENHYEGNLTAVPLPDLHTVQAVGRISGCW